MIFIRNDKAFVQLTSLPENFKLKLFSYQYLQVPPELRATLHPIPPMTRLQRRILALRRVRRRRELRARPRQRVELCPLLGAQGPLQRLVFFHFGLFVVVLCVGISPA